MSFIAVAAYAHPPLASATTLRADFADMTKTKIRTIVCFHLLGCAALSLKFLSPLSFFSSSTWVSIVATIHWCCQPLGVEPLRIVLPFPFPPSLLICLPNLPPEILLNTWRNSLLTLSPIQPSKIGTAGSCSPLLTTTMPTKPMETFSPSLLLFPVCSKKRTENVTRGKKKASKKMQVW